MKHQMKLKKGPFIKIQNGTKTVEMRLYDEKRKKVQVGDTIEFVNEETGQFVIAKVIGLHLYESFKDLYNCFDKVKLGYDENEIAKPEDMEQYYSKEEILKHGVIGIEIR